MSKRGLKKEAKRAEKIILERNKEFYDNFIQEHYPKKSKGTFLTIITQHKYCAAISISSVAVAVLTLVLCLVFLLPNGTPIIPDTPLDPGITAPPDDKKHYVQENEVTVDTSIAELNADLTDMTFTVNAGFDVFVKRVYDSVSSDTLYYTIALNDNEFTTITFDVYVNKDYEHTRINEDNYVPKLINGFEFNYFEETTLDVIYSHAANALMTHNGITVYVEYSETSLTAESTFLELLEQIVQSA